MANDLTGDFDVVAQFSLGAANRVLAAMHAVGRLPHSWSLRVDDYTHFTFRPGDVVKVTGVRAAVDRFGEPVTNPTVVAQVSTAATAVARPSPSVPVSLNVDSPVNLPKPSSTVAAQLADLTHPDVLGPLGVIAQIPPIELFIPKHLNGVAQLQLGPPTVTLLENSDTGVVIHTAVMARYYRDEKSLDLPHFLRGEFQTAIGVKEVASSSGKSIDVVLAGKAGNVKFVPNWVSPAWDSEPEQLAAINKAALNSLTSSFEPSSTPLPGNILNLKFKTLDAGLPTLAMMMDLPGGNPSGPPDPNSVWNAFLQDGDDFAFAMSEEFVQAMFSRSVDQLRHWGFSFSYEIDIKIPNPLSFVGIGDDSYTIEVTTITFTVDIGLVTVALQNGQILVTVTGTANTETSGIPQLRFTASQAFTLELVDSPG